MDKPNLSNIECGKRFMTAETLEKLANALEVEEKELFDLMNRGDVYTAYPVESVYGVIQVKSVLTKKEIKNALDNIASYKKLNKHFINNSSDFVIIDNSKSKRGFGILFAYDSDLDWIDIVNEIKVYAENNPDRKCWCIFIFNFSN